MNEIMALQHLNVILQVLESATRGLPDGTVVAKNIDVIERRLDALVSGSSIDATQLDALLGSANLLLNEYSSAIKLQFAVENLEKASRRFPTAHGCISQIAAIKIARIDLMPAERFDSAECHRVLGEANQLLEKFAEFEAEVRKSGSDRY
jgi:hypothetical protein